MWNILILLTQLVLYSNCYEIRKLNGPRTVFGISPFYDAEKNSLLYLDAMGSFQDNDQPILLRYDFAENKTYAVNVEGLPKNIKTGFIIPFEGSDDLYAFGAGQNFYVVQWDGVSTAKVLCTQFQIDPFESNFIHVARTDAKGRFWAETMRHVMCDVNSNTPPGSIYLSTDGKTIKPVIKNLKIANDFIFDDDKNILYYGDTCVKKIRAVDVDPITNAISNERVVYDDTGSPYGNEFTSVDGIGLEEDGSLWMIGNGEGIIFKLDAETGNRTHVIPLPARLVPAFTWGGPNFDILYVASTEGMLNALTGIVTRNKSTPENGYIYEITGLGVKGRPLRKIDMRFASCMNDQAVQGAYKANDAPKHKKGFKAKVKKIGAKVKKFFHDDDD